MNTKHSDRINRIYLIVTADTAKSTESDKTQTYTERRRRAQDPKTSRDSRNQVNLLSRIHGSLLSLLPCQQAAPFVGILSGYTEKRFSMIQDQQDLPDHFSACGVRSRGTKLRDRVSLLCSSSGKAEDFYPAYAVNPV